MPREKMFGTMQLGLSQQLSHVGQRLAATALLAAVIAGLVLPGSKRWDRTQQPVQASERTITEVIEIAQVEVGGKLFRLEIAADARSQERGLSGRGELAVDEGMIFVFEDSEAKAFYMKDCTFSLDLITTDKHGRIVSIHEMKPQAPRNSDEGAGETQSNARYLSRLRAYIAESPCDVAIELRGGSARQMGLGIGGTVNFDEKRRASIVSARSMASRDSNLDITNDLVAGPKP